MVDIIAAIVIVLLFTGASVYIYREKKKGSHCIGCPMAGKCNKVRACQALQRQKVISSERTDAGKG